MYRELGVFFRDLRVSVPLLRSPPYKKTVWSLLSGFLNPLTISSAILRKHHDEKDILDRFDGVVRPGEMLRERYRSQVYFQRTDVPTPIQSYLVVLVLVVQHFCKRFPDTYLHHLHCILLEPSDMTTFQRHYPKYIVRIYNIVLKTTSIYRR